MSDAPLFVHTIAQETHRVRRGRGAACAFRSVSMPANRNNNSFLTYSHNFFSFRPGCNFHVVQQRAALFLSLTVTLVMTLGRLSFWQWCDGRRRRRRAAAHLLRGSRSSASRLIRGQRARRAPPDPAAAPGLLVDLLHSTPVNRVREAAMVPRDGGARPERALELGRDVRAVFRPASIGLALPNRRRVASAKSTGGRGNGRGDGRSDGLRWRHVGLR